MNRHVPRYSGMVELPVPGQWFRSMLIGNLHAGYTVQEGYQRQIIATQFLNLQSAAGPQAQYKSPLVSLWTEMTQTLVVVTQQQVTAPARKAGHNLWAATTLRLVRCDENASPSSAAAASSASAATRPELLRLNKSQHQGEGRIDGKEDASAFMAEMEKLGWQIRAHVCNRWPTAGKSSTTINSTCSSCSAFLRTAIAGAADALVSPSGPQIHSHLPASDVRACAYLPAQLLRVFFPAKMIPRLQSQLLSP